MMNLHEVTISSLVAAAVSFFPLMALADDAGSQLKGSQVVRALVGPKLHGVTPKGVEWGVVYKSDGTAVYDDGSKGTWSADGDKFCDHENGGQEICFTVYKLGDKKYQWIRANGNKGSVITAE